MPFIGTHTVFSRRLFLLYLYHTICKQSENICIKVMANLLTVSLEWVWISKRQYIWHFFHVPVIMEQLSRSSWFWGISKVMPKKEIVLKNLSRFNKSDGKDFFQLCCKSNQKQFSGPWNALNWDNWYFYVICRLIFCSFTNL